MSREHAYAYEAGYRDGSIHYELEHCPACKNVADLQEALAENARLRTFLGGGSIVTDYWKDEDGTMHVLTTDGEHTYEYMRGGLADENAKLREDLEFANNEWEKDSIELLALRDESAKLRELVADMWNDMSVCYEQYVRISSSDMRFYGNRLRELGIEVDV